eukprot:scaffold28108_cov23-Tisochrysis_lutea.AAC.2
MVGAACLPEGSTLLRPLPAEPAPCRLLPLLTVAHFRAVFQRNCAQQCWRLRKAVPRILHHPFASAMAVQHRTGVRHCGFRVHTSASLRLERNHARLAQIVLGLNRAQKPKWKLCSVNLRLLLYMSVCLPPDATFRMPAALHA